MKAPIPLRRFLYYHSGLMAVVQLLIVAALVWLILLPQMRTDIGLRQQTLARALSGQVTAHLMGGERHLKALAEYLQTREDLSVSSLNELLDTQCGAGDLFETIYLVNRGDKHIASVGLSQSRRDRRLDLMGLDLSGRDFLNAALDLKKSAWSNTFLSTVSSRLAVALAVPLPTGLLVGEIAIDHLSEFIGSLPLERGRLAMVLDRRGTVVADSQKVWGGRKLSAETVLPTSRQDRESFDTSRFDMDGRQMVGTVVTIDALGWQVLVAQNYQDAYQAISSTFLTLAFGLALALSLTMILSWFQARKLSHIFQTYGEKAKAMAAGQYELDWPRPKTREFSILADNLRNMAAMIGAREQQLVAGENKLRTILDSIGDAVIATDGQGLVTRLNPTAEQLTGWSSAEAMGRPLPEVFRIVDAQTRQASANPVDRVLAEDGIVGLANHTLLISRDGREYQIADSGAPIRRSDGTIAGVVLVFRDVTEAYLREQKIRDNEKLLKNITANVPGVVYRIEAAPGHVYKNTYASGKSAEIFGIEAKGQDYFPTFLDHIPDEDQERFLLSNAEAVENEKPWYYEGRFIKDSGETIWFSGSSVPSREGDNLVFYGVLTDITERKKWESALAASELRFKDLFNEAPVMYVITENKNNEPYIRDVNNMFMEVIGYSRQELVGTPLADYYTDDSKRELFDRKGYKRALDGEFLSEERVFVARDGRLVHTLLHAAPEYDENGLVTGTRALFLDVTARKQAEEETGRLQTALWQSQKMEAIGTLAGGIAHDFNNILSAVIGYSELAMTHTDKKSRLYKNLEQILVAGLRARDLVKQILTFSRQDKRELKPLQVGPLVKEAFKLLRSSLPATVEMNQEIAADLDNVMADPTEIHRIVMNLCTNAAQAMEPEGGVLTLTLSQVALTWQDARLHPGLKPGPYLKLSVEDTGQGISPEVIDRIFDPYFTTKDKDKGTGLGLSLVHGIAQSYGGAVYVYSEPGRGSIFKVYIPAIKNGGPVEKLPDLPLPTGSEQVLLVDDEAVLVEVGRTLLEMLGYQVTGCTSGPEALEVFSQDPRQYDLVISDVTMPKMTGDKLAVELLRIRPDLPIILYTGFTQLVTEEKAAEIGVKALAMKPMVKDSLAFLVRRVLDESGPAGEGHETGS